MKPLTYLNTHVLPTGWLGMHGYHKFLYVLRFSMHSIRSQRLLIFHFFILIFDFGSITLLVATSTFFIF